MRRQKINQLSKKESKWKKRKEGLAYWKWIKDIYAELDEIKKRLINIEEWVKKHI